MADSKPIRARNPREDISGRRFGRLVVDRWAGNSRWHCICDCGGAAVVLTANLKRANTSSCGCIKKISDSRRATTHGLSNTRAYKTWLSVRRRCFDTKTKAYLRYGAVGIGFVVLQRRFNDDDEDERTEYADLCPGEAQSQSN